MRLYAFLLLALCALAARAATIPENVAAAEKKISIVTENTDKASENVSSEQELIDQANTINEVDNKLRAKPEDIPVEVVVEDVALKKVDDEEIVRPQVDLRNPGPPQRQEHETQNPEFYAAEQQIVQIYKQNLNQAQATLKDGLKSVSDNVQNMVENNEQVNIIQQGIQGMRENFMDQINKLNSTLQQYLNGDNASPEAVAIKTNAKLVEGGLNALRNDFYNGVKSLTDSVQVVTSLRAENEENRPPTLPETFTNIFTNIRDRLQNMTTAINNFPAQFFPSTEAPSAAPPAGAQSDTQAPTTTAPNLLSQMMNSWQNIIGGFQNLIGQTTQSPQAAQPAQPSKPEQPATATAGSSDDKKPEQTAQPAAPAAAIVSEGGPIRQILQNNPISQGIANAVQRLQNINNPDKPRDTEKQKAGEKPAEVDNKPKGHPPAAGDNNNSDVSRLEENQPPKQIQSESLPEPQPEEPKKEEQKTQEVVDKTE